MERVLLERHSTCGPQRVSCSFCGLMSPDCGAIVTGLTHAVICEHCVGDAYRALFGTAGATGQVPDDKESAEEAIRAVFAAMVETTDDGNDLPNVDGGEGIGRCMREGPRHAYEGVVAVFRVTRVRFLGVDEAEVFFVIEAMGDQFPRVGRAVFVDGRWLVSRETIAEVLKPAGIRVPPRA